MDQTHDTSGQQLYRLTQLFQTPKFVKSASTADICGEGQMAPELYGDPVHMLFPCHSQASTWVSNVFFLQKRAEFKPYDADVIDKRLLGYARYHRIENAVDNLRKQAESLTKEAYELSDDDYALVVSEGEGKRRHYPIRNSTEVKKAASFLSKNRDFLPFPLRREFADKVLQKAAQLGAKLGDGDEDLMQRTAGYGACATKTAVDMLRDRVRASRKGPGALSEAQAEMLKLASTFETRPKVLLEAGMRVKLASVVDDFDRAYGLNRDYGKELQRPEDVLFELTNEKMASVVAYHVSNPQTGAVYRLVDLGQVKIADVRKYMGDDFANEIAGKSGFIDSEKVAEIIPTMDRGFAAQFDSMMSAFGIRPAVKEASADGFGFSRDYLHKMAAAYEKSIGR